MMIGYTTLGTNDFVAWGTSMPEKVHAMHAKARELGGKKLNSFCVFET